MRFDIVVLGGGHAGLTAAITAAERGVKVCVLEVSPENMRGGNSRHTRNLRPMHESAVPPMEGVYGYDEYLDDLLRVTGDEMDKDLAALTIQKSSESVPWLQAHGVSFQPPLTGTLQLGRTNAFFLGGGKALMNSLFRAARHLGVMVLYETTDIQLDIRSGRFESLTFDQRGVQKKVEAPCLIAASGGFEANLEWLKEAWGDAASNFLVRGTPFNRGDILTQLLNAGCEQVGDARQCHAVAIDGRAPRFDGGICTRVDSVPLGIVVNRDGQRFYDEGEDFWPKRYASWGRLVADQPGQIAWSLVDNKASGLFMPTVFPAIEADTLESLASQIEIDPQVLKKTVDEYNATVQPGAFDHQALDDCRTTGLAINKSHWARRIDEPPFRVCPLRPGITFTYLGVSVDERARVAMSDHSVTENIFAAGEIMAGNILGRGYLAGIGMTIGSVFGRVAGEEAARHVTG